MAGWGFSPPSKFHRILSAVSLNFAPRIIVERLLPTSSISALEAMVGDGLGLAPLGVHNEDPASLSFGPVFVPPSLSSCGLLLVSLSVFFSQTRTPAEYPSLSNIDLVCSIEVIRLSDKPTLVPLPLLSFQRRWEVIFQLRKDFFSQAISSWPLRDTPRLLVRPPLELSFLFVFPTMHLIFPK